MLADSSSLRGRPDRSQSKQYKTVCAHPGVGTLGISVRPLGRSASLVLQEGATNIEEDTALERGHRQEKLRVHHKVAAATMGDDVTQRVNSLEKHQVFQQAAMNVAGERRPEDEYCEDDTRLLLRQPSDTG